MPSARSRNESQPEKTVPTDVEAEEAVLGSLLIDPAALEPVAHILQPGDFYREANRWIFEACLAVVARGDSIDQVTVRNELDRANRLAAVGGLAYLAQLVATTPTSVHAVDYAQIVQRCAVGRWLISASQKLAKSAYDGADPQELIAYTLDSLKGQQRNGADAKLITWADVAAAVGPIEWDWPQWLPRGFLTVLAAEQEAGKSILALRIAMSFVLAQSWPDGSAFGGEPGAVLWCEAESAQAMNLERAAKWGIPTECIHTPLPDPLADVRLDRPTDREAIGHAARHPDVRLVVVDSLRGASRTDEKDSAFADAAFWLASLARDIGLPVLAIHHLRKRGMLDNGNGIALDRLRGHSSITQAARMVWALDIPNPSMPDDRRLYVIKSNLAQKPGPIGMGVDDTGVFFGRAPELPKAESQTDKAIDLLQALLDTEPMLAEEVEREAKGAGISWVTVKRAKERLHVVSSRRNNRWYWSLPAAQWAPEEE